MAGAVLVTIPVRHAFVEYLAVPVIGAAMSRMDVERLLARHTWSTDTPPTYRLDTIGDGQWVILQGRQDGVFFTAWQLAGLADDHLYLLSPQGDLRAFTAIRTAEATTAPADPTANLTTTLLASGADFSAGTPVAVGDVVVLASGAHAYITAVDATDQLTTEPLPYGETYAAGQTFHIGRAPGTDATPVYTATARQVSGTAAAIQQIDRWLTARSFDPASSVGGSSTTRDVAMVRMRKSELMGVTFSSA